MDHLSFDRPRSGLAGLSKAFAGLAQSVGTAVRGLPAQAARWHKQRQGLEALRVLSDRQLRDIGICRAEIAMVAYGVADPREAPSMEVVGGAAMRPVPKTQKADNCDEKSFIGSCAA